MERNLLGITKDQRKSSGEDKILPTQKYRAGHPVKRKNNTHVTERDQKEDLPEVGLSWANERQRAQIKDQNININGGHYVKNLRIMLKILMMTMQQYKKIPDSAITIRDISSKIDSYLLSIIISKPWKKNQ